MTKTPRSERFGEVYGTTGSFAHKEAGFDFGDNVTEDDTLSYRLTGKVQRAEGEYDFSENDENFIQGGLTWRPTDMTSLTFVYDHLDRDGTPSGGGHPLETDFDRDRFFGEPDYNYDTTNRNTYSVMVEHDFGNGLSFDRMRDTTGRPPGLAIPTFGILRAPAAPPTHLRTAITSVASALPNRSWETHISSMRHISTRLKAEL